jgi:hypothetical protein
MNNQDSFLEDTPWEEEDNSTLLNTGVLTMEKDAASGQKKSRGTQM